MRHYGQQSLWLAALLSLACSEPTGQVSGRVVDWITGDGIAKAKITVFTGEVHKTESAKDGTFRFEDLEPGDALIRVEAKGYQTLEYPVGSEFIAPENGDIKKVGRSLNAVEHIRLLPINSPIQGTVRVDGQPYEGARISLECGTSPRAERFTDAEGRYDFKDQAICILKEHENIGETRPDSLGFFQLRVQIDYDGNGIFDEDEIRHVPSTTSKLADIDFSYEPWFEKDLAISGLVLANRTQPVPNAALLLQEFGQIREKTRSDGQGRFSFKTTPRHDVTYNVIALPADLNGDGKADTGSQSLLWTVQSHELTFKLPGVDTALASSNACIPGVAELNPGEPIYLLWDASLQTDRVSFQLMGPSGDSVPFSAKWEGSYYVTLIPDNDFEPTSGTEYFLFVDNIFFANGEAEDIFVCTFEVRSNEKIDLASPSLELDWSLLPEATGIEFDANSWSYVEPGKARDWKALSGGGAVPVPMVWDAVEGATRYTIYGRQKSADPNTYTFWDYVKDFNAPSSSRTNPRVYQSIHLGFASGGAGQRFSFSNEVELVVVPYIDQSIVVPSDDAPTLKLKDTTRPRIANFSRNAALGTLVDGRLLIENATLTFSEPLNTSQSFDASRLKAFGGRVKAIELGDRITWDDGTKAVADTLKIDQVKVALNYAAPLRVSGPDNNGYLHKSELVGSLDYYAEWQRVAYYHATSESVSYRRVSGVNTQKGSISIEGLALEEDGDRIFDPCASAGELLEDVSAGTKALKLGESLFFVKGQVLEVENSGLPNVVVDSWSNGILTLTSDLPFFIPAGGMVKDPNCESIVPQGNPTRALRGSDQVFAVYQSPVSLSKNSNTLTFLKMPGPPVFPGVVKGDLVLIDGDGDTDTINDQVLVEVKSVETVEEDGKPLEDSDGNKIARLHVSKVTPLNNTQLPMGIKPSKVRVTMISDGLYLKGDSLSDTSGNGPVNTTHNAVTVEKDVNKSFVFGIKAE